MKRAYAIYQRNDDWNKDKLLAILEEVPHEMDMLLKSWTQEMRHFDLMGPGTILIYQAVPKYKNKDAFMEEVKKKQVEVVKRMAEAKGLSLALNIEVETVNEES